MARQKQKQAKKKPTKAKSPKKSTSKKSRKPVRAKKRVSKMTSARSPRAKRRKKRAEPDYTPVTVQIVPPATPVETFHGKQLPENYGDNMIHVLIRDPECIYAFWEIQRDHQENILARLGGKWDLVESILRVHDWRDEEGGSYFDIPLQYLESNYFIHVEPNKSYVVEIGLLHQDGRFIALASSEKVTTPRNEASDVVDEKWMTLDFEKIYAASGGLDVGLSSLGLKHLMEERLRSSLSSGGSAKAKPSSRKHASDPVTKIKTAHK